MIHLHLTRAVLTTPLDLQPRLPYCCYDPIPMPTPHVVMYCNEKQQHKKIPSITALNPSTTQQNLAAHVANNLTISVFILINLLINSISFPIAWFLFLSRCCWLTRFAVVCCVWGWVFLPPASPPLRIKLNSLLHCWLRPIPAATTTAPWHVGRLVGRVGDFPPNRQSNSLIPSHPALHLLARGGWCEKREKRNSTSTSPPTDDGSLSSAESALNKGRCGHYNSMQKEKRNTGISVGWLVGVVFGIIVWMFLVSPGENVRQIDWRDDDGFRFDPAPEGTYAAERDGFL